MADGRITVPLDMELCPSSKEEDESVGEADEWVSIDRENVDILNDLLMENQ